MRLLGIDTPESVAVNRPEQCYGKESAAYLTSLLPEGTEVTLSATSAEISTTDSSPTSFAAPTNSSSTSICLSGDMPA